jgi:endothelin-converting enzyme
LWVSVPALLSLTNQEWTTLKKIQSVLPEINFQAFFTGIAPPGFRIDANQTIGVHSMDYYRNLSKIITSTPRETLHDYFQWQLIAMWADRLHDSYTAPIQRYENQLLERPQNFTAKRPDICRLEGDYFLPYLWDGAFVQRAFTMGDKRLGEKIVKELKNAIVEDARTQEWMSDSSKKALAAKGTTPKFGQTDNLVSNMVELVGFQTSNPNEGDPRELNEYYAQLKLGDSYFENGLAYSHFRQARFWATLFKVYNRDKLSLQPVDYRPGKVTMPSDVYMPLYVGDVNMIDVPAGTMQMPRFGVDIPEYVTYAAWGSTIMHEILTGLYGFEQYQRLFDNSTAGRYKNSRDCFAKQYQQYLTADFKNVTQDNANNDFSVDWMLGDRHSLRITYAAWKAHSSDQQNTALPGLERFTNDQLFFINYANSLCEKKGKTPLPIPLNYKRIVAALPESTDFSKAFNCPAKPLTCPL